MNSEKTGYGEVGSSVVGPFASKAVHEGDQASGLRAYVSQNPEVKQTPTERDYRALWLGLKAELQFESESFLADYCSHVVWKRMDQAERSARLQS